MSPLKSSVKIGLLLILTCSLIASVKAQTPSVSSNLLGIELATQYRARSFTFKPQKIMKLKQFGKKPIKFVFYEVTDSALIINSRDTILYTSVEYLKGRVYGNADRKIAGVVIALAAPPAAFLPLFIVAYGGASLPLLLLTASPFVGMMIGGIDMTGARKFRSNAGWRLVNVKTSIL